MVGATLSCHSSRTQSRGNAGNMRTHIVSSLKPLYPKRLLGMSKVQVGRTNGKDSRVKLRTSSRTIGEDGPNPKKNNNNFKKKKKKKKKREKTKEET